MITVKTASGKPFDTELPLLQGCDINEIVEQIALTTVTNSLIAPLTIAFMEFDHYLYLNPEYHRNKCYIIYNNNDFIKLQHDKQESDFSIINLRVDQLVGKSNAAIIGIVFEKLLRAVYPDVDDDYKPKVKTFKYMKSFSVHKDILIHDIWPDFFDIDGKEKMVAGQWITI